MSKAVYVKCSEIDGIRFWRADFANIVPRFEVFRVIARNLDNGNYYFRSLRNPKTVLQRSFYQLNTNGFHPFCYNGEGK